MEVAPNKYRILAIVESALEKAFRVAVAWTAEFMSAVLSHPAVQNAAAQTIVCGMNAFLEQDDLPDRLRSANERLSQLDTLMAREAGAKLPKLASEFWRGMRGKDKDEEATKLVDIETSHEDIPESEKELAQKKDE